MGVREGGPRRPRRRRPAVPTVTDPSDTPEREIWSDTFSAKGLVAQWCLGTLLTILGPAAAAVAGLDRFGWQILLLVLIAYWAVVLVWLIYLKLDVYYVLTNQRLMHRHGILTRHSRRIEVIDIDDISYRQNIVERLVGVGTIEVISSDVSDPLIELAGIDRVREVAQMIDAARRAERIRRGLHIEAV